MFYHLKQFHAYCKNEYAVLNWQLIYKILSWKKKKEYFSQFQNYAY